MNVVLEIDIIFIILIRRVKPNIIVSIATVNGFKVLFKNYIFNPDYTEYIELIEYMFNYILNIYIENTWIF